MQTPKDLNGWALAILDGHGMLGEKAAELAGKALFESIKLLLINTLPSDVHQREEIVIKAFATAHEVMSCGVMSCSVI